MAFIFKKGRIKNKNQTQTIFEEDDPDKARHIAIKAGFVSLKERINNLKELRAKDEQPKIATEEVPRQPRQFATLSELFSSKFNNGNLDTNNSTNSVQQQKRPKIPIMKLSKEDWNVKCWEDRVAKRRSTHERASARKGESISPNKSSKPLRQVEIFQGRIDDVAHKLEKVREGVPIDEKLYQMTLNKGREVKSSHEWTDLLKSELASGTHNPQQLRAGSASDEHQDPAASDSSTTNSIRFSRPLKSPLGRPIRSIFDDSDDDD